MTKATKLLILCTVLPLVASYASAAETEPAPGAATVPAVEAPKTPAAPAAVPTSAAPSTFTKGKIVETMNGGGYTYLRIENAGQTRWAALPLTAVSVGQEVEIIPNMDMHNFPSKALGRTFETITFCSGLVKPQ